MDDLIGQLSTELEKHGYKVRLTALHHLADLRKDIEGRHAKGCFDPDFYSTRLTFFNFQPPDALPDAQSIIIVAAPSPQTRASFTQGQKTIWTTIPPTYIGYNLLAPKIEAIIASQLAPHGFHTTSASGRLPFKTLAVRSGLCEYGRNNITFTTGMGSFLQLAAFFSDLPSLEDSWREPVMLERCQKCKACANNCPTHAIASDRFLLHAERCLVFFNERPPEIPFPDWVNPAAHNSLIGCMTCQQVCPEDKEFIDQFANEVVFSEAETSLLRQGVSASQLPTETIHKLELIDMVNDLAIIPRNLSVFFD